MIKQFAYRLGNLEARVNERTATIDIVQWTEENSFCWTIAYFDIGGDRSVPDLKFIGDGPLKDTVNWQDFRTLINASLAYLTEYAEQDE